MSAYPLRLPNAPGRMRVDYWTDGKGRARSLTLYGIVLVLTNAKGLEWINQETQLRRQFVDELPDREAVMKIVTQAMEQHRGPVVTDWLEAWIELNHCQQVYYSVRARVQDLWGWAAAA